MKSELGRTAVLLVGLLLAVQLAAAFMLCRPGPLIIDEVAYDWAARAFSRGNGWFIDNGYEELRSAELAIHQAQAVAPSGKHLVSKYPSLFPLIASPLHPLLGFQALCAVNALGFTLALWALWKLSQRFFQNPWLSLASCTVLVGSTYAWEYASAGLPHAAALATVLWAQFWAMRSGDYPSGSSRAVLHAALAGLAGAVGLGFRLDMALLLAGLGAALLLQRPLRWRPVLAFGGTSLLGAAFLSFDNHVKHGVFLPFYYGNTDHLTQHLWRFLPILGVAALAVLLWHRAPNPRTLCSSRLGPLVAGTVLVIVVGLVPALRDTAFQLGRGLLTLLVDMRLLEARWAGFAEFTAHGSVVFDSVVKTALLQSCPFLVLAVIGARRFRRRSDLSYLLLPSAVLVLALSPTSWHGGHYFTLRYFVPLLPVGSLLVVAGATQLVRGSKIRLDAAAAALGGLIAVTGWTAVLWHPQRTLLVEVMLGPVALGVVGTTAALVLLRVVGPRRIRRLVRRPLLLLAGLGVLWGTSLSFGYHYLEGRWRRDMAEQYAFEVADGVTDGSLLLAGEFIGPSRVPELRDVWIADPSQDGFADAWRIVGAMHQRRRPVYVLLQPEEWDLFRSLAPRQFSTRPVRRVGPFLLFVLQPPSAP